MHRLIICISLLFFCQQNLAQSVVGKWKTFDIFNKNKEESIVELSIKDDKLYVKIIHIIPKKHRLDICRKCTDDRKNMPITGMIILKGATLKDGVWQGVKILNAKNGNEYDCHISLDSENRLRVRGFIGYPIFGKTLYWTRVHGNNFR